MLADRPQPFVGLLGQLVVGRVHKVGVRPLPGPPDPAPQLVQLAQPQHVGTVDHEGVHGGHVYAGLDNRRAHQDVVAALPEVQHDPFQRPLVHLAVGNGNAGFGDELAKARRHLVDVADPVVDEEDLAFPEQFPPHRFRHRPLVVLADVGEDGAAFGRGCRDEGEVPYAGQGHFQSARYRRSRHRKHVHICAQLLYRLFVVDPETLFLVHHEQAQVLELDVAGQQFMRADDDVHRPVGQAVGDRPRFGRRQEAGEHLHPDRVIGEAVAEILQVLGSQQRRGHEHGHLLAVLYGLERRPHGHLGLADPHVPADEPVHRDGRFHVRLDVDDRLQLVGRLFKGKGLLHLRLPRRVGAERVAGGGGPSLVKNDQLVGDFAHGSSHAGFCLLPLAAVQAGQRRRLTTRVRAKRVDLVRGYVQLVAVAVIEHQVVALDVADGPLYHAAETGHAVLEMHDVVPGLHVVEKCRHRRRPGPADAVGAMAAGEVAFGQDRHLQRRVDETALDGHRHDLQAGAELVHHRGVETLVAQRL